MEYDACVLATQIICDARRIKSDVYKSIVDNNQDEEMLRQAATAIVNAGWNGVDIAFCGSTAHFFIAASGSAANTLAQTAEENLAGESVKKLIRCYA